MNGNLRRSSGLAQEKQIHESCWKEVQKPRDMNMIWEKSNPLIEIHGDVKKLTEKDRE